MMAKREMGTPPKYAVVGPVSDYHGVSARAARRSSFQFSDSRIHPDGACVMVLFANLGQSFLQSPDCRPDFRARRRIAKCLLDSDKLAHNEYVLANTVRFWQFLLKFEKRAKCLFGRKSLRPSHRIHLFHGALPFR